jgi:hypothetical protein
MRRVCRSVDYVGLLKSSSKLLIGEVGRWLSGVSSAGSYEWYFLMVLHYFFVVIEWR